MLHLFSKYEWQSVLLYLLLPLMIGIIVLWIPLLRDFHVDSAMVAGLIGCFWAAIKGADAIQQNHARYRKILVRILSAIYLTALPLLVNSLWNGCFTTAGLGFWVFIPVPSVAFGLAVGRLCRRMQLAAPKLSAISILIIITIGLPLLELLQFPQVYFFNHVWGIWPGPIYDEAVQLSGSFFFFRWLTILWIILLWVIPDWHQNRTNTVITVLASLSLMLSYPHLDEAGIISPNKTIQQQLGGQYQAGPVTLFYDKSAFSPDEVAFWAARHEFHFQQITQTLQIDWPQDQNIESYLYADAWQKKELTGAKFTSYVPVWLKQHQMHIAKQQLPDVLKHEMVHIIAKQFGNRLFNASWSMGLTEGLAEALAIDRNRPSTLHQIVAAEKPWPDAQQMRSAFSITGFYKQAGATSYTTAGSFTHFLLDNYPVENLKEAYRTSDIETSYQQSWDTLIDEWHTVLRQTPVDSTDRKTSAYLFAQKSLFEKTCPRSVNKKQLLWDRYRHRLTQQDSAGAYAVLSHLHEIDPDNNLVADHWARMSISRNNPGKAAKAITPADTMLHLQLWAADGLYLTKGFEAAKNQLSTYRQRIKASNDPTLSHSLQVREDSLQWRYHIRRQYYNYLADSTGFQKMNLPNKILTAAKAIQLKQDFFLIDYAKTLAELRISPDLFSPFESITERLIFWGEFDSAKALLQNIERQQLRPQQQLRLQELAEWMTFMQQKPSLAD